MIGIVNASHSLPTQNVLKKTQNIEISRVAFSLPCDVKLFGAEKNQSETNFCETSFTDKFRRCQTIKKVEEKV